MCNKAKVVLRKYWLVYSNWVIDKKSQGISEDFPVHKGISCGAQSKTFSSE